MRLVPFLQDEHLAPGVKEFLTVVNGGDSMDALSVSASRQGLADLQQKFVVDHSGIDEFEKEVMADGFPAGLSFGRVSGLEIWAGGPGGSGGGATGLFSVHSS